MLPSFVKISSAFLKYENLFKDKKRRHTLEFQEESLYQEIKDSE